MTIKVGDTVQFVNDENQMLNEQQWEVERIYIEDDMLVIEHEYNRCLIPLVGEANLNKFLKKVN